MRDRLLSEVPWMLGSMLLLGAFLGALIAFAR